MRVVISRLTTGGRKTGVGFYASQLVRHLPAQTDDDRIDVYPGPLLLSGYQGWRTVSSAIKAWQRRTQRLAKNPLWVACGILPHLAFRGCYSLAQRAVKRHFRSVIQEGRYDLYHEPNYIPFQTNLPTLVTVHDLSVLLYPQWHPAQRVIRFETDFHKRLGGCRHVLTDSEFIRQQVIRELHFPAERVSRVHLGVHPHLGPVPTELAAAKLRRLGLKPNYLLYLGTIEPRKNVLMLMQAYCSLPQPLRERCPLLLVGQWGWKTQEMAAYYDAVARHQGVRHLGYVPDRLLPAIYNGARALVYPSFYEGFGLPPVEMLACGGAVLASTAETLVETVGGKAHLIPPHDVDGWRAALARIIVDDEWRASLRHKATDFARRYTWKRCAAETVDVYRLVTGSARTDSSRNTIAA
jgi:alpha-1,3-rhamnosyl/mannosyltransferase